MLVKLARIAAVRPPRELPIIPFTYFNSVSVVALPTLAFVGKRFASSHDAAELRSAGRTNASVPRGEPYESFAIKVLASRRTLTRRLYPVCLKDGAGNDILFQKNDYLTNLALARLWSWAVSILMLTSITEDCRLGLKEERIFVQDIAPASSWDL